MRSELCIYDLANGTIEIVLTTDRLIEAPNWSSDGKALIVNGDGHIYRVALARKAEMVRIDTGFAVTCNNDHGLSPDGREMVISDGTENGQSCIYILPVSGGTPRKVTDKTPSYGTAGRRTDARSPIALSVAASSISIPATSAAVLKRASRTARATPTALTIRPTASGSGSTPAAQARHSCGACIPTAAAFSR